MCLIRDRRRSSGQTQSLPIQGLRFSLGDGHETTNCTAGAVKDKSRVGVTGAGLLGEVVRESFPEEVTLKQS